MSLKDVKNNNEQELKNSLGMLLAVQFTSSSLVVVLRLVFPC